MHAHACAQTHMPACVKIIYIPLCIYKCVHTHILAHIKHTQILSTHPSPPTNTCSYPSAYSLLHTYTHADMHASTRIISYLPSHAHTPMHTPRACIHRYAYMHPFMFTIQLAFGCALQKPGADTGIIIVLLQCSAKGLFSDACCATLPLPRERSRAQAQAFGIPSFTCVCSLTHPHRYRPLPCACRSASVALWCSAASLHPSCISSFSSRRRTW